MNWLVIMAGGAGERFWPMSRRKKPKQLLPIVGKQTMIQETITRLKPLFAPARIMVVTNAAQAAEVRRQLPQVRHIIAEPAGRNTAPCIGLAAAMIRRHDPDAVMAVVPADGWIGKVDRYRQVFREALEFAAQQDALITMGIRPTRPHTGYGYIQLGDRINKRFWKALRFVEKPDRVTAERYFTSGRYRWNAGIFVWSLRAITAAYRRHQPVMWTQLEQIQDGRSMKRIYPQLEKVSVDYAIMEKAANVIVANGDFPWDDVGDWAAVARHFAADAAGNVARGAFAGVDASGCVAFSSADHLIGVVGVHDLVVVHTPDATLVCPKSQSQKVRDLVKQLAAQRRHKKLL